MTELSPMADELLYRLRYQPCNCRSRLKPKGASALLPEKHEADCSFKTSNGAIRRLKAAASRIERLKASLKECSDGMENWILHHNPHYYLLKQKAQDLECVRRARELLKELDDRP